MTGARLMLALGLVLAALPARADDAASDAGAAAFERANAQYESGDFAGAVESYTRAVESGIEVPELFYNLGNAYFKEGDLGRAILWYERARRLSPRDADLRENLDLTRSLIRDQELVPSRPRWRRVALAWHHDTTAGESVVVASVLYAIFGLVGVLFVFRESAAVSRVYAKASLLSPGRLLGLDKSQDLGLAMAVVLIVGGAFGYSAVSKIRAEKSRPTGVVLAEEASVFSGPSRDAPVQFKVHEGTLVSVRDARPGWLRVDLPGDLSGWIDEATLDRI